MHLYKFKKGLTLIELIVTLAILSLVLMGIYSLFGFGNRTYAKGTKQYDIQSNIRLASDYVIQQVRYATDMTILNDPDLSSIQPYENYIYFDTSNNTITHFNKYFTKTVIIGHPGAIEFKSLSPYKLINFNIRSQNGSQAYNISSEVISMNLHLSTGGIIGGTPSGTPLSKSGNTLYYKTANDYMAIKLRPVAQYGTINEETRFEVDFDRDISRVEVLNAINMTDPDAEISGRTVVITSSESMTGATLTFRVTFVGTEVYGNTYDYTVEYGDGGTWNIESGIL